MWVHICAHMCIDVRGNAHILCVYVRNPKTLPCYYSASLVILLYVHLMYAGRISNQFPTSFQLFLQFPISFHTTTRRGRTGQDGPGQGGERPRPAASRQEGLRERSGRAPSFFCWTCFRPIIPCFMLTLRKHVHHLVMNLQLWSNIF